MFEIAIHTYPFQDKSTIVRRRPSPQQGRALEKLGHAIEYLVDSRPPCFELTMAEKEALSLLKQASCRLFDECPEVLRPLDRLCRWVAGTLHREHGKAVEGTSLLG